MFRPADQLEMGVFAKNLFKHAEIAQELDQLIVLQKLGVIVVVCDDLLDGAVDVFYALNSFL